MSASLADLRAQLAAVEARLPKVEGPDALAQSFHLGKVGFRRQTARQARRADAAIERTVDEAVAAVALRAKRDQLRAAIADIESGRAARREEARALAEERLRAAEVGAVVVDSIYGECRVVRRNKAGLTVETSSGYREARPWALLVGVLRGAR